MVEVVAVLSGQETNPLYASGQCKKDKGLPWEFVDGKAESGETKGQALI